MNLDSANRTEKASTLYILDNGYCITYLNTNSLIISPCDGRDLIKLAPGNSERYHPLLITLDGPYLVIPTLVLYFHDVGRENGEHRTKSIYSNKFHLNHQCRSDHRDIHSIFLQVITNISPLSLPTS